MKRLMRLPKNSQYPNYAEVHEEDEWCSKVGCVPACTELSGRYDLTVKLWAEYKQTAKANLNDFPTEFALFAQWLVGKIMQSERDTEHFKRAYGRKIDEVDKLCRQILGLLSEVSDA